MTYQLGTSLFRTRLQEYQLTILQYVFVMNSYIIVNGSLTNHPLIKLTGQFIVLYFLLCPIHAYIWGLLT